jgi:hypothetical protein
MPYGCGDSTVLIKSSNDDDTNNYMNLQECDYDM